MTYWKIEKDTATRFCVVNKQNGCIFDYYKNLENADLITRILNDLRSFEQSGKRYKEILNFIQS